MKPKTAEKSDSTHPKRQNESTRERVLEAAFTLFCEHGFSDVSMLEIATRAQVSKRDLYAVSGNPDGARKRWTATMFTMTGASTVNPSGTKRPLKHPAPPT